MTEEEKLMYCSEEYDNFKSDEKYTDFIFGGPSTKQEKGLSIKVNKDIDQEDKEEQKEEKEEKSEQNETQFAEFSTVGDMPVIFEDDQDEDIDFSPII